MKHRARLLSLKLNPISRSEVAQMTKYQIRFLMRRFQMTEAQAQAIAALIWGAC